MIYPNYPPMPEWVRRNIDLHRARHPQPVAGCDGCEMMIEAIRKAARKAAGISTDEDD